MGVRSDVRHALRWLVKHPGFSTATLLTVALGVGGTAAIFSASVRGRLSRRAIRPHVPRCDERQMVVVGSSMGGSCALEMARIAGHRIAALILVGAKAGHSPEPAVRDAYVTALRAGGLRHLWPTLAPFFAPMTPSQVVHAAEDLASEQSTEDLVRAVRIFHSRPDATDVVRNWQRPLAIVTGAHDALVAADTPRSMIEVSPNGRLHTMKGCGHFPNLENPNEFNRIITDVIREVRETNS